MHRHRRKVILFFIAVGAVVLPGPQCRPAPRPPAQPIIATSGPSAGIAAADPKYGVKWKAGKFPPGGNGNIFPTINAWRKSMGLTPLIWHDGLSGVATKHSRDMNNRNYFSTVTPEGVDIFQRLVSSRPRIDFTAASAFVISNPYNVRRAELFNALMRISPAFRGLVENPSITHFAADSVVDGGPYGTIIFGQNVTP